MEEPEARIARTESEHLTFVCECGDPDCTEKVAAPLGVYEDVRSDGTQFLLVPGHEDERVERVVEERPRYSIVRKVHQAVAAYVRRLDPRAETA